MKSQLLITAFCASLLTQAFADTTQQEANKPSVTPMPAKQQTINCQYKLTVPASELSSAVLLKWASHAAQQAFDFDYTKIDQQITALEPCFTKNGWASFNKAMTESGNIAAIKEQQFQVKSKPNGTPKLIESKDNKWQVMLPLEVTYQNKEQKLTQDLYINLNIGLQISGNLGINQIIASTQKPSTSSQQKQAQTDSPTTQATAEQSKQQTESTPAPATPATPSTQQTTNAPQTTPDTTKNTHDNAQQALPQQTQHND